MLSLDLEVDYMVFVRIAPSFGVHPAIHSIGIAKGFLVLICSDAVEENIKKYVNKSACNQPCAPQDSGCHSYPMNDDVFNRA